MIEKIIHNDELYALIIRAGHQGNEVEFYTPNEHPIQMGYMNRKKGYKIDRHKHSPVQPTSIPGLNQEVLIIKTGLIHVTVYDINDQPCSSFNIKSGDVIMFFKGGHAFEMLESSDFIEIKHGPYDGKDKILF